MTACYRLVTEDPPYEIQPLLRQTGLQRLVEVKNVQVDKHFISALVERWRPETHTFHFPYGECTVTLEDVALLFGLPIDGEPVTGMIPDNIEQVRAMCYELLGLVPEDKFCKKNAIGLDWLKANFGSSLRQGGVNADNATILQWHTRGYILRVFGALVFPDKSKDVIHPKYLSPISDIGQIHTYSWGSACLAFMYRALCRATRIGVKQVDGPLMLLQAWVWYRLPCLAPVPRQLVSFPFIRR